MSHGPPPHPHEPHDPAASDRSGDKPPTNGFGITGIVLGAIAVFVALFSDYFFTFLPWAIAALVPGLIARDRAKQGIAEEIYGQWAIGLAISSAVIEYVWYLAVSS